MLTAFKWIGLWMLAPVIFGVFMYMRYAKNEAYLARDKAVAAELQAERDAKASMVAAKQCSEATERLSNQLAESQKELSVAEDTAVKKTASAELLAREIVKHIDNHKTCTQAMNELRDAFAGKEAPRL